MSRTKFVYVIYIQTTAEKIWQAITDRPVTRQFWGYENVSDWKPGATWEHMKNGDPNQVKLVGKVIEVSRPSKLVISWADPADRNNLAKHSRVTYDIVPIENMCRLTVTHDDLEPGSEMERGIMIGWPLVLSSMKSFLETGKPINIRAAKESQEKAAATRVAEPAGA